MTAEQSKYRIDIPTETKFMRLLDGEEISTEATDCELELAAQLVEKEWEVARLRSEIAEHVKWVLRDTLRKHDMGLSTLGDGIFYNKRAEAAEQRLQEAQAEAANHIYDTLMTLRERLRQREAELEQRWIAVGERLPALYERVRVYASFGESHSRLVSSLEVYSGEPFWEGMPSAKVTHWQPLSSPPKEAK